MQSYSLCFTNPPPPQPAPPPDQTEPRVADKATAEVGKRFVTTGTHIELGAGNPGPGH